MAEENTGKKKGSTSVSEAGRKGGQTVRHKYGHSFYEEIGRKGGAERGRALYEQIGKKGGEAVKAERGTPFYEQIGNKAAVEAAAAMPKPVVADEKTRSRRRAAK